MSTAAAFRATYADWKLIKTRSVVQIVFEVPLEAADHAYRVVGGMPNPASETWFGIAKLKPEEETERPRSSDTIPSPQASGAKPPGQVAGYLCTLPAFWKFINEEYQHVRADSADSAAQAIRIICSVKSRADLTNDNYAWRDLRERFRIWEMALV